MPIVSKPRQICIDLDPDRGYPVSVTLESLRVFVGESEGELPAGVHRETFDPSSDHAKAVFGEACAAAVAALLPYQREVQRLASELAAAKAQVIQLEQS